MKERETQKKKERRSERKRERDTQNKRKTLRTKRDPEKSETLRKKEKL